MSKRTYSFLIRKYPSKIPPPPSSDVFDKTGYFTYYYNYYESVYYALIERNAAMLKLVDSELNPRTRTTFIFKYYDDVHDEDSGFKNLNSRFTPPVPPPSFISKENYALFYEVYYSNIKYYFTSAASSNHKNLYETFSYNYDDSISYPAELYDFSRHVWKNPEIHHAFIELTKVFDKYVSAAAEDRIYSTKLKYNYPLEVGENLPSKIIFNMDLQEGHLGTNLYLTLLKVPDYLAMYNEDKNEII